MALSPELRAIMDSLPKRSPEEVAESEARAKMLGAALCANINSQKPPTLPEDLCTSTMIRTDQIKKGSRVRLQNGWEATVLDNCDKTTLRATVYGDYTETGSIYAHDIVAALVDGKWVNVNMTEEQDRFSKEIKPIFASAEELKRVQDVSTDIDEKGILSRLSDTLVIQTIEDLKQMKGNCLLSGDDSGLENTWVEICVQVQQEESFYWDDYISTIEQTLTVNIEDLPLSEQQLLWLSTEAGFEWQYVKKFGESGEDTPPVFVDDIVQYLKSELLSLAEDYENSRITRYINGDEDDENVDEDEDEVEEEESDDDEVNADIEEDANDDEEAENETIPIQPSLFGSLDSVPMNPMILKAIDLAAKAHATQLRKGTDTPYISHPTAVGMLLSHYGCSASVVAAGILHDTVEDGDVTLDDITKLFGPEVAQIVNGCSEPDKSATWIPRKLHTIEYLQTAPRNVKLAAAADKLHNVTSMLSDYEEHGEALWSRFKRGREDQEWYYRGVVESLGSDDFKKHPLYVDLKLAVGKMFDVRNNEPKSKEGSFMEPLSPRMQELMAQSRALPQLPPEEAAEFKRRGDLLAAGMCAMIKRQ